MAEAFHCRLKGPVLVDKKTLMELQGFQAVSVRGGQAAHGGLGWVLRAWPSLLVSGGVCCRSSCTNRATAWEAECWVGLPR